MLGPDRGPRIGPDIFSNAVTRGFKNPHGMASELVYRAEDRFKSKGALAGAFPKAPRGRVGLGIGPTSTISGPTLPPEMHWSFHCVSAQTAQIEPSCVL